jgi:selenocysteine lyase/cysteine desulfurase
MSEKNTSKKNVIDENYDLGVPDFALREAVDRFVDDVREHVKKFILVHKSDNVIQQRESLEAANEVLEVLREEAVDLLNDKLWMFTRNV